MYNEIHTKIKESKEEQDAYIKEFVSKSSLNTLYNTLPNITEETIALMHAYVDKENNWKVNNNIYLEPKALSLKL